MQDNQNIVQTNQILFYPMHGAEAGIHIVINGVTHKKLMTHDDMIYLAARILKAAVDTDR